MNSDSYQALTDHLDFSCVHAYPDIDAHGPNGVAGGNRAIEPGSWPLKGDEEPVARGVDLESSKATDLVSQHLVVRGTHETPSLITQPASQRSRPADVGEH